MYRDALSYRAESAPSCFIRLRPDDLVLGPSAGGRLRDIQRRIGGRLLTDLPNPSFKRVVQLARDAIDETIQRDRTIAFDLTYFRDLDSVLRKTSPLAQLITAQELLHIKRRFSKFRHAVLFIKDDRVCEPPF